MRPSRRSVLSLLALAWLPLLGGCGASEPEALPKVRLATTTSARDAGLLDWLKPEFRRVAKVEVIETAVGTGLALEQARRGDADLVLVHDRKAEDTFVRDGWGVDRRDVMWNDFLILGPPEDPAGIKGEATAAAALAKIAAAKATFASRADKSGTHSREISLWEKAGGRPAWPGYLETGQGQAPTTTLANEKRGYVLSDRGTYVSMRKRITLVPLVEGDPALKNPYGAILANPEKVKGINAAGAKAVLDYLTSPAGQARIGAFQVDGEVLFHPAGG